VLDLCSTFKQFAANYFDSRSVPALSWKFFLLQKDYARALAGLQDYSMSNLASSERSDIESWIVLISSALKETQERTRS
jgi:hypothetical protein